MTLFSSLTSNDLSFCWAGSDPKSYSCKSLFLFQIIFLGVPVYQLIASGIQIHLIYLLWKNGSGPFKYFSLSVGIDIQSVGGIGETLQKESSLLPGSLLFRSNRFLQPSTCSFSRASSAAGASLVPGPAVHSFPQHPHAAFGYLVAVCLWWETYLGPAFLSTLQDRYLASSTNATSAWRAEAMLSQQGLFLIPGWLYFSPVSGGCSYSWSL